MSEGACCATPDCTGTPWIGSPHCLTCIRQWTARRPPPERDEAIRKAVAAGATHREVAEAFGISRGRVGQIVRRGQHDP